VTTIVVPIASKEIAYIQNIPEFLTDREASVVAADVVDLTSNIFIVMTLKKPTKRQSTIIRRRIQSWSIIQKEGSYKATSDNQLNTRSSRGKGK
jgi:hypothetical protein